MIDILFLMFIVVINVPIHEAGHWLRCRHYGIKVKFIVGRAGPYLKPENKDASLKQWRDIYINGPFVSFIFGIVLACVFPFTHDFIWYAAAILSELFCILNLLPISGTDGEYLKQIQKEMKKHDG